jgi:glucose-6-phosphate isomerase
MQEKLETYLNQLKDLKTPPTYKQPEEFINLPFDEKNAANMAEAIKKLHGKNRQIKEAVIIGIGGSSLGTKAVYEALNPDYTGKPKLHFLDQINLKKIYQISNRFHNLNSQEGLVIVISKSGKTLETIKNYQLLKKALDKEFKTVFITKKDSDLSKEEGLKIYIPEKVGGRFSVFSAVGLFPLAMVNIEILEFLKGGMEAKNSALAKNSTTLKAAINTWGNFQKGKEIYNIFVFSPELKALGSWYQQLLGESLGKNGKGLFPTVTEGSKDLHSLQQYFMEGKQNVQHEFLVSSEENHYQKEILNAVQETYSENDIPFKTTEIKGNNENSLGKFMQNKMIETLFLGKLMEVDPFGQPGVEGYKQKIRNL